MLRVLQHLAVTVVLVTVAAFGLCSAEAPGGQALGEGTVVILRLETAQFLAEFAATALDPDCDKSSSGELAKASLAIAAEFEAVSLHGQRAGGTDLLRALLAFSEEPLSWPSGLRGPHSVRIWRTITTERWFRHIVGIDGVLFPLFFCPSVALAPVADAYKQLVANGLHGTAGDSSASHVMLLSELRGQHICDRSCLLLCATSYAALALHAAHAGDARDVARYLDAAQDMFLTSGLLVMSEALEAEQGSTLSALWGLLTAIWGSPFMRSLWQAGTATRANEMFPKVFTYPVPEAKVPCPKASALAPLPASMALGLYRMVETVGQVLTWHGIVWFASHGTLLGAVRHQGIIPHDCDVDFTVVEGAGVLLMSAAVMDSLLRNGYEVAFRPVQNLFAIFRLGSRTQPAGWSPQGYTSVEPHMNIYTLFPSGKADNMYFDYLSNPRIHGDFTVPEWSLFPTSSMRFGASTVRAPKHPDIYLNTMYGNDWSSMIRPMSASVHDEDFAALELGTYTHKMAVPVGPLREVELPTNESPFAMDASESVLREGSASVHGGPE